MRKVLISCLLAVMAAGVWAADVPCFVISTTTTGEITVPIASIQKITYNDAGTEMYIFTAAGKQTIEVANVVSMTLSNLPTGIELPTIDKPSQDSRKVVLNGQVYIIQDGHIYTLKGEKVQ